MAYPYYTEDPQPSEKQLKQILKNIKYPHHVSAAKQVFSSLDSLPDLKTSIKEYTQKDGKKTDLMLLDATVPAKMEEIELRIPIQVWLLRGFPKECPLVFVSPDSEYPLASVSYLDDKGKVKLPYLLDWKETRSDLSTLGKMLKYKFGQQCPLNCHIQEHPKPTAAAQSSLTTSVPYFRQSYSGLPLNLRMTESMMTTLPPPPSVEPPKLDPKLLHMKIDLEKKDREITSYQKTIEALTEELDGLGKRVKELEQTLRAKEVHARVKVDKATAEELENVKEEKAKYQELLKELTEKFQQEMQEKDSLRSKLNAKISDLTQTREKVAILEVDLEDCQQKLQRRMKDLRQSKCESREVIAINKELKLQITTLAELDQRNSTVLDNEALESASFKIQQLEDSFSDALAKLNDSEAEKLEMQGLIEIMSRDFQRVENSWIRERAELEKQLFVDAKEFASSSCQTEQVCSEKASQDQTDPKMGLCDKEVQEDSLSVKDFDEQRKEIHQLKQEVEDGKLELRNAKKDSEVKIVQLLGFKEALTKKNEDLRQKLDDFQQNNPQMKEDLIGDDRKKLEEEIERLKNEKENLVVSHTKEKRDIITKVSNIKENMLKKNSEYEKEITELKNQIKKISLHAQNSTPEPSTCTNARSSNESIVSSRELKVSGDSKIQEGSWGFLAEGTCRGTSVTFRVVSSSNIKRFSVAEVYQQVSYLSSLRHPNIIQFLAAAMDTPEGLVIMTELYTQTLDQALQDPYSANTDRLPAMLQIALALNYLHLQSKPVVHGNLSSSCISIQDTPGHPWKAKLTDLGLAAPIGLIIKPDEVSLAYKVPAESGKPQQQEEQEQQQLSDLSIAGDVYSYGALMSEASLALRPSSAREMNSLLVSSVKEQFPAVFSLIQACLSPADEQRPAMGSLASKLQNLVSNRIKLTSASRSRL